MRLGCVSLVRPARLLLGSALATALFGAGWWTGHILPRPAPAAFAVAPEIPPSADSASASPTRAEAVSQFAGGDRAMTRAQLRARLTAATPAEIPGLLAWVAKLPHRLDRERFRAQLLAHWVNTDPTAARVWAETRPLLSERRAAVRDVLAGWAQTAPATVAGLIKSADGWDGPEALDALLSSWVANDPAHARAWVIGIENPLLRGSAIRSLISAMAEQDPSAALETALALRPDRSAQTAVGIAARAMILRDPSVAASVLDRIPAGSAKHTATFEIVSAMATHDPKLAAEFALTLPPSNNRSVALRAAIGAMADDADASLAWIQSTFPAGPERDQSVASLIEAVANHAPAEAARHLELLPPEARAETTESLVRTWAEKDSAGTTTWAKQLPAGPERDAALRSLLGMRFQSDPVGALTEYQREFSEISPAQLEKMVNQGSIVFSEFGLSSGALSTQQLLDLLPLLPSDETRKQLIDCTVGRLSMSSPETAAALITTLPTAQRPDEAIRSVADQWAASSPTAAAAWAATLSDTTARRHACNAVLTNWGRTDPDAAARWACSLPDEQLRRAAAEHTAGNWAANDPAAAAQWVAQFGDATFRAAATEAVARTWLFHEFETAAAWLATTDLPPERKAALLQSIRR